MKKPKKPHNTFIRFTGLAIEMGATIYVGSLLGKWLDERYPNPDGLYTKIVTLVAVFLAMYLVISQVMKNTEKDQK